MTIAPTVPPSTSPPGNKQFGGRGNLWRRLLSGGIWVIGARFCGITSMVLTNVVLARKLAPEAFGDFVVVSSITNAGSLVAIFGMNSGIVRFVAEQLAHENLRGARHVLNLCFRLAAYATSVTSLVVLAGMALLGSQLFSLPHSNEIALLTACALAIQAFSNLNSAALRGLGEMRFSSILGGQGGVVGPLANTLFLILVSSVALTMPLTLVGALTAYVAAFAIALAVGSRWVTRTASNVLGGVEPGPIIDQNVSLNARSILFACFPMLMVQVLSTVTKQGGLWVAGSTCSPQDLALYAAASRAINLVAMPLSLVNLSVMAFIPQLRAQSRLPELEKILRVSAGWAAIPSFMALIAFVVMPAQFLGVFLGENYRHAAGLLSILSFGQFVFVWSGLAELTLVLSGRARAAAIVNAVAGFAILAGGPIAAHFYGPHGLAVVAATVIAGQCLSQWLMTRRLVGIWTHAAFLPWRLSRETV